MQWQRPSWAKALAGQAEGRREGQAGLLRRLGQAGHVCASGPEGRSGELGRGRAGWQGRLGHGFEWERLAGPAGALGYFGHFFFPPTISFLFYFYFLFSK